MNTPSDPVFTFVVNGTQIQTRHEKLLAIDIIRLAIEHGAITGKPENYILESIKPERTFKSDDFVDLHTFHDFITETSGPTPVALEAT